MSKLYINLKEIQKVNSRIKYIGAKVESVKLKMETLKQEIPEDVAGMYGIGKRLTYVCGETEKLENHIKKLHDVIASCARQYECTEMENERYSGRF